ncbi:hypothetical protein WAI453_005241 [Rhynchosporium graminicola]
MELTKVRASHRQRAASSVHPSFTALHSFMGFIITRIANKAENHQLGTSPWSRQGSLHLSPKDSNRPSIDNACLPDDASASEEDCRDLGSSRHDSCSATQESIKPSQLNHSETRE